MTDRILPHDPYITAVIDALTAAGLGPDNFWTSDAETDRYDDGPDSGCTTMLSAYLDWDTTDGHEHGLALMWEHPAEQWSWAPRSSEGHLQYEPEFLPLNRWADPAAVVDVVRVLHADLPVPAAEDPRLWADYVAAGEAVREWAETSS